MSEEAEFNAAPESEPQTEFGFAARDRNTPKTLEALTARARSLMGLSLGELAARHRIEVPLSLRRAKGFVGALVERALDAPQASRAGPDFPKLGIELKTIPVKPDGTPSESTFVCGCSNVRVGTLDWAESPARAKLAHVLFVPIEAAGAVASRRIGRPVFHRLTEDEDRRMAMDWDLLAGKLALGERVSASLGEILQVRPKASSARARQMGFDGEGLPIAIQPSGFYLRARFTKGVLARGLGER